MDWSTSAGSLENAASPTAALVIAGSATVVATFRTETSNEPIPSFTWTPSRPTVGTPVQFVDGSSGAPSRYAWDFNEDGNPDATTKDATYTFKYAGRKPITLTVWNAYGSKSATQVVESLPVKSVPRVTAVRRALSGFFLEGASLDNRFDAVVDWAGARPGTLRFSVNGSSPSTAAGGPSGASWTYRMDKDFPAALTPNVVRIVPVTADGIEGIPWEEKVLVFPFPSWLSFLREGGRGGTKFSLGASGGEVIAGFGLEFPKPHIGSADRPTSFVPPSWVPYLGGSRLGLSETFIGFDARVSSLGTGEVDLRGATGFEAMGQSISGSVSGAGKFRLGPPNGLEFVEASGRLEIRGEVTDEKGILEIFPQTAEFAKTDWGSWINDKAKLEASLGLNVTIGTALEGSPAGVQFKDTTAKIGFDAKAVLRVTPVERVTAEAWLSGDGSLTIGFREPYLREADLAVSAGVRVEVDATFRVLGKDIGKRFKETASIRAGCRWSSGPGLLCSKETSSSGADVGAMAVGPVFGVDVIRAEYDRFGPYAVVSREPAQKVLETGAVSKSLAVSNVFRGASPRIVDVDGGRLLLWSHQNPDLDPVQATDIGWSFQGSDGRWSDMAVVQADQRAEMSPTAARTPDGRIVAAWLRNKVPAFSEPIVTLEDLPRFYTRLEVVSSAFDPRTRSWSPVVPLTDDEDMDTDAKISKGPDGRLMLTWIRQPGGVFESSASKPAILMAADWSGDGWARPVVVASGLVGVSGHAVVQTSAGAAIAVREGSSGGKGAGIRIYRRAGASWGPPEILAGGEDQRAPRLAVTSGDRVHAVWLDGDKLVYRELGKPEVMVVRDASGSAAFQDAQLIASPRGSLALLWQKVSGNEPAHVYARLREADSNRWTEDVRIDDGEALAYSVSGSFAMDSLSLVYLETEVTRRDEVGTIGGETYRFRNIPDTGRTSIVLLERPLEVDLEAVAGSLELTPSRPLPGQPVRLSAVVRNRGQYSVDPFSVVVSSGDKTIHRWRLEDGLAAGAEKALAADLEAPAAGNEYTFSVDPQGEIAEVTKGNNVLGTSFSNAPPVVALKASSIAGAAPLTVDLDASGTLDPEGGAVEIQWLFGDGTGAPSGSRQTHRFVAPGRYIVTASARDSFGAVGNGSVTITVGTVPELGSATSEKVFPIVLDLAGQGGARYSTELSLCNTGSTASDVELQYTAADSMTASGSGSVWETLGPGAQLGVPDAIAYLRSHGLDIPGPGDEPQAGTLRLVFSGLEYEDAGQATARTGALAGLGRAGLAYSAQSVATLNRAIVRVFGLRESTSDRSHLALANAGRSGPVTLTVKLFSGEPASAGRLVDSWREELGPGQWKQINRILTRGGLTNGYVEVERTSGAERFTAYGVFNDNGTNDGSFIPAIGMEDVPSGLQVVPVVLETPAFGSELVLANPNPTGVTADLVYVESLSASTVARPMLRLFLAPGEQLVIPEFLDYMRGRGIGIGPRGGSYAGALRVTFSSTDGPCRGFAGARTSTGGANDRFGLFYVGVGNEDAATSEAWVVGLQQNGSTRSNVAFVNRDGVAPITLEYTVFSGSSGTASAERGSGTVVLGPGGWIQKNGLLGDFGVESGYVRVRKLAGGGSFAVYGVLNDGGGARPGTNDGSYVPMTPRR